MAGLSAVALAIGGLTLSPMMGTPKAQAAANIGQLSPYPGWVTDPGGTPNTNGTFSNANRPHGLLAPLAPIDEDVLYMSGDYIDLTGGWVGRLAQDGVLPTTTKGVPLVQGNGSTRLQPSNGYWLSSMAIDANALGTRNGGKKYAYFWSWDGGVNRTTLEDVLGMPRNTLSAMFSRGNAMPVFRIAEGETMAEVSYVPTPEAVDPTVGGYDY